MDSFGHSNAVFHVADIVKEHGKFVAADASQGVVFRIPFRMRNDHRPAHQILDAQTLQNALGNLNDQIVAGLVSQAIVHDFHAIDVDEKHRKFIVFMPLNSSDGSIQAIEKQRAVRKVGKCIVKRAVHELVLRAHQILFRVLQVRNIKSDSMNGPRTAVLPAEHFRFALKPDHAAIARNHSIGGFQRRA